MHGRLRYFRLLDLHTFPEPAESSAGFGKTTVNLFFEFYVRHCGVSQVAELIDISEHAVSNGDAGGTATSRGAGW